MAIGLVTTGSNSSSSTGVTSITVTPGSVPSEGDVVILCVTVRGGTGVTVGATTPFQIMPTNGSVDSGTTLKQVVMWRIAGPAEPSTYTVNFSSSQKCSIGCIVLSGCDRTNPIDASSGQANASGTTITAPGVTVTASGCWLLGFFGSATSGTISTYDSPLVESYDTSSTNGAANTRTVQSGTNSNGTVSTGATGNKTAVCDTAAVNIGQLVAVKPLAQSGTTVQYAVGSSSDDATASNPGTPADITATVMYFGNGSGNASATGMRFTSVNVPKGATINYAYILVRTPTSYIPTTLTSILEVDVSCQAADNPGTFTTSGTDLSTGTRPRSTAKTTNWKLLGMVTGVSEVIPVTSAVQEIVNRSGWAANNAIVVIADDSGSTSGEWQDIAAQDHATVTEPQLVINYTVPVATRTVTPVTLAVQTTNSRTVTPATIAVQVTNNTRTVTPATLAVQEILNRTVTPNTAAIQTTEQRTVTPNTAAIQTTENRTVTPVTSAVQVIETRTVSPVTIDISTSGTFDRTVTPVTLAVQSIESRTVTPNTVAVQTTEQRTVTPSTVAVQTTEQRTVTPATAAIQTIESRSISPVTIDISTEGTFDRTVTPVTLAVLETVSRTVTPNTVAVQTINDRTVTPSTVAVQTTESRSVTPTTAAIQVVNSRTVTPVTISLSLPGTHQISVGPGFSDVNPRTVLRTSGDRVYIVAMECDSYPCDNSSLQLRVYKANQTGVPASFARQDSANEPAGIAGWAAAIDGTIIHIAWLYRSATGGTTAGLRYTTFNTSTDTWSGTVETLSGTNVTDGIGQGVQVINLELDSNGVPHLVYLNGTGTSRRVYYRNRIGGTWSSSTQIDGTVTYTGNQKAWHPNLAFDTTGRIIFAFERGSFNGDNDGTIFIRTRETGGTLNTVVNVSGTDAARVTIDQSTALLITRDNRYHLVYITSTNDYWRYAYSDNNGVDWSFNNPGSGTHVSHNPSLGPDGNGGLRIYGHGVPASPPDGHGDDLYYFEGSGGSSAWGSWTQYTTGSLDSSVACRWSQYFYFYPSKLDIIFWDDSYPNNLFYGYDQGTGELVSRTVTPVTISVQTALSRTVTPVTLSASTILSRSVTPVTLAAQVTTDRTITPVTSAVQTTESRTITPVTSAVQTIESRTVPVDISISVEGSFDRTVTPVTMAVQAVETITVSPVTISTSVVSTRSVTPVTIAASTLLERTVTPVTQSISTVESRTVPVTLSVEAGTQRVVPSTISVQTTEVRSVTPVTLAASETLNRTLTPITLSLALVFERTLTSVTASVSVQETGTFNMYISGQGLQPSTGVIDMYVLSHMASRAKFIRRIQRGLMILRWGRIRRIR